MSTLRELYITMENLRKLNLYIDEIYIVDSETPVSRNEYESAK